MIEIKRLDLLLNGVQYPYTLENFYRLKNYVDSTVGGITGIQGPPGPTGPAGAGESNTASNAGVGGVGVFLAKVGVDLEFKNINAGSSK